jgi:hypothetical protein
MIKFLYERDYINRSELLEDADDDDRIGPYLKPKGGLGSMSLLLHTKMYVVGDKYDIPALKKFAVAQYKRCLSFYYPEINLSAELPASLRLMYEETPESDRVLKDIAMATAGLHVKDLMKLPDFAELIKENGEIAFDILQASMAKQSQPPSNEDSLAPYVPMPPCSRCSGANFFNTVVTSRRLLYNYHCRRCGNYFN